MVQKIHDSKTKDYQDTQKHIEKRTRKQRIQYQLDEQWELQIKEYLDKEKDRVNHE